MSQSASTRAAWTVERTSDACRRTTACMGLATAWKLTGRNAGLRVGGWRWAVKEVT